MEHICDTCEFYEDDKCRFVGWRKTKNEQCLSWREALEPLYPDWKDNVTEIIKEGENG